MKIKKEHYEIMEQSIFSLFELVGLKKLVNLYETGDFDRSEKVKDLQKRFCFDMFYFAQRLKDKRIKMEIIDEIYEYANDTHIYTALRNICPKVERKY